VDQVLGDEGTRRGGSPNYQVGAAPSNGAMRMLQQQNINLRSHLQSLQAQIETKKILHPQYHVCSWEHVRSYMQIIQKRLMLGLDLERCKMKSLEAHMKEAILGEFDVPLNDKVQRKAFDRAWIKSIKTNVLTTFNNRRGRFSTSARIELWRLLGVPKPMKMLVM